MLPEHTGKPVAEPFSEAMVGSLSRLPPCMCVQGAQSTVDGDATRLAAKIQPARYIKQYFKQYFKVLQAVQLYILTAWQVECNLQCCSDSDCICCDVWTAKVCLNLHFFHHDIAWSPTHNDCMHLKQVEAHVAKLRICTFTDRATIKHS